MRGSRMSLREKWHMFITNKISNKLKYRIMSHAISLVIEKNPYMSIQRNSIEDLIKRYERDFVRGKK